MCSGTSIFLLRPEQGRERDSPGPRLRMGPDRVALCTNTITPFRQHGGTVRLLAELPVQLEMTGNMPVPPDLRQPPRGTQRTRTLECRMGALDLTVMNSTGSP